jgi:hypothetical protein
MELAARGTKRIAPTHHDQVVALQPWAMLAKAFPHDPLEAVAVHGPGRTPLRDGESQTCLASAVLASQQDKAAVAGASRRLEDAAVVARAAKPGGGGKGPGARPDNPAQGARRALPLARRALMILRPLRVCIRARKPWVRARLIRLGWKVLFIAAILYNGSRARQQDPRTKTGKITIFTRRRQSEGGIYDAPPCG